MRHRIINKKGFTLIELLLAMALFTTVVIVSTAGFVGLNRTFNRGLIKKQLSDNIQATSDDLTQALRANSQTPPNICQAGASGCDTNWSQLCFTTPDDNNKNRYVWHSNDALGGGLYKISGACGASINTDGAKTLVDDRYFVRDLKITPVNTQDLFKIDGVITTTKEGLTNYNPGEAGYDPYKIQCVGSSNSNSRTCAVQQIDLVVSTRNGGS